ncbi:flavodoxin family protein [Actinotalea sp. K2]|uniref:flavodoxin family protein n=1 Tax=Actinotalea sp. K2 TaxID=2939438 RepID=UPI00201820FB|nr:NAD(P)H-dependent oxidoreductase [Actinotalea sp. K2]MCL3860772.1 NAD(P)H-dependent oxidoreductase [Actinotalea sp. K2]
MTVKVAVIYYSSTGNVHDMAVRLEQAATAAGAEVRRRRVTEIAPQAAIEGNPAWAAHVDATRDEPTATPQDIDWADVVLLGSPTRFGNVTSQFQQYIDTLGPLWAQGKLADKVYAGFTSSQTTHGGQESTLLSMYHLVHHFGGILVAPGYTAQLKFTDGNPYGVSHVSGPQSDLDLAGSTLEALDHLAQRTVAVAGRLAA